MTDNSKAKDKQDNGNSSSTLATSVYDRLRDDVLSGRLRPGSKLRTEYLRERYQIGNSPIREALNRLSADGFVVREDQRGFRVSPVSRDDLQELVKTRCWLEELAIRESFAAGDTEWEEGLVLAYHRLSRCPRPSSEGNPVKYSDWERLHRAFHMALISGCGSRQMVAFCEELFEKAERYRRLAAYHAPDRNELDEHRQIMEASINGEIDRVVELLREHYGRTMDIILSLGVEFFEAEAEDKKETA